MLFRMRNLFLAVALLSTVAACGKSRCDKYADMEVKCGNVPEKEQELTRALAGGMCSQSGEAAKDDTLKEMAQRFQKEADCAEKYTDCSQYKQCTDAIK
jgi:hypothetical protein